MSDIDYPGWIAGIDGNPAPLYKTDGIFRGVVVPAGEHRVTMRYRPVPFRVGLGLAAMALLVMAVAVWRASALSPDTW